MNFLFVDKIEKCQLQEESSIDEADDIHKNKFDW